MYEFLTVHMLWISVILCITGLICKAAGLFMLTKAKQVNTAYPQLNAVPGGVREKFHLFSKGFFLMDEPVLFYSTLLFHILLILTPLFLFSHNLLLYRAWGIDIGFIPDRAGDFLTVLVIAGGLFLMLRRIFIREVNILTTWYDFFLLAVTLAPFVTGFMAFHQAGLYENIIVVHIVSAEIFFVALGWTKLGHMVFFIFSRFFIGSEFSFTGGSRKW